MSARYNRDSRRTPGWTPRFLRGLEKTNEMKPATIEKQRPDPQRRSRFLKKTKIAFVSPTAPTFLISVQLPPTKFECRIWRQNWG